MKDELARTGKIIREKAIQAGETIGDAAVDAGISTKIKAKLVQDAGLSAFRIDVDTNDRMVTLSGTVSSLEEIDRAMNLALETDGVRRVVSTLQIKGERHN
jgi:hyperosmotically inducible protein